LKIESLGEKRIKRNEELLWNLCNISKEYESFIFMRYKKNFKDIKLN
jgi:hypothetical protein